MAPFVYGGQIQHADRKSSEHMMVQLSMQPQTMVDI
jgi:hypothetical protein